MNSNTQLLVELASRALKLASGQAITALAFLEKRMRKILRIRLASNILGAISTAGVCSAVLTSQRAVSIATAIISFLFSTVGLLAQYVEDFSGGSTNSPRELKERFGRLVLQITELEGELHLLQARKEPGDSLVPLVQRANALVANVRHAEVLAGIGER